MMGWRKKLWGLRSGKPWKMILALIWDLLTIAVLWFGMAARLPVEMSVYDRWIYRLSVLVIFVWMNVPTIFLSDTVIRNRLPLFRRKVPIMTLAGLMIVFLFFAYLFASVDSFHTEEYRNRYEIYVDSLYDTSIQAGEEIEGDTKG